jgi:NAD(P)-dependent dehydrogenase (short-subunit alcohol dehydrogenase family)
VHDLTGRTGVITGAGSGIGRVISLALAAAGANVVVADIDHDSGRSVAGEISAAGGRAEAFVVDVSDLGSVGALADFAYDTFGSVEVLVNNAGVTMRPFRATWDTAYADYLWIMSVNFWGVLNGHHVFVPRMRTTAGSKHIVNTSSTASLRTLAGHAAYSAAKAAVDAFSLAAREELMTQGIGLSLLHPGPVRTRITDSERLRPAEQRSDTRGVVPWSSYLEPSAEAGTGGFREDVTESDPDLASDPEQYISPRAIGEMVLNGIRNNQCRILTHPAPTEELLARVREVLAGAPQTVPRRDRDSNAKISRPASAD